MYVLAGSVDNNAGMTIEDQFVLAGGTLTNGKDGVLTTGSSLVDEGIEGALGVAAKFDNAGTWNATNLGIGAGTLTNTGTLAVENTLSVTAGTFNNNSGGIANIGKDLGVLGTVNNSGILTVDGTAAVAKDATLNNRRGFEADKLGVSGTLNNWGGIHTTTQAFVDGTVNLNAGSQWLVEGNGIGNTGSITGLGSMTINGGALALNSMDSKFEVGTLNVMGGSTLMHGIDLEKTFTAEDGKDYAYAALIDNKKNQLMIGKTLNVKNLNVGTSATTLAMDNSPEANFGSDSMTILDASAFKATSGNFALVSGSETKLAVDEGASLLLSGVGHGGQYNLAQGFDLANSTINGWTQADGTLYAIETSGTGLNWILDIEKDFDKSELLINATLESVADNKRYNGGNALGWNVIHKNIVDEVLRTALADNQQASTMSLRATAVAGAEVGFTNKMYGDLFMNNQLSVEEKVLVSNSLASVAQNIGVESLALDNVTDTMKGIEDHASMVGTMPVANGSNLWAQVLGTEHKQDGMKSSGGAKLGYDADDRGFMIGYDIVNGAMNARYGFAMSYLDGSVSSVGDYLATTGDYNTFGLHGYMNWAPAENVNVIATVGYSRGNAEASMNLPKLSGWDSYVKATADVDTNIFSAGIRAETSIKVNNVNIVPHAGLRVMAIDVNGYDTKIDGTTAFHNNADTAVIGQLPFGVTVKGEFETNGWNVKPMADVTFVPQFGETKSQTKTTFPGGTASDMNVAEFTGNFSTNFTFGVEAQKGDYSVGMELGVTKGQNNKTDSSFMAKVRYQF